MATHPFDLTLVAVTEQALDFLVNILGSSTEYSTIGKDLDGKIHLWHEGARGQYEYESDEVFGKANSAIHHAPEDVQAGMPRAILDAPREAGKWEGTIDRMCKNGQRFLARVVITPRQDAARGDNGPLLISKDEVSDEIRLAEPLNATQFHTRSSIGSHIDALMATDPLGVISDVNQQIEALTGRNRDELIGSPFKTDFTVPNRAEEGIRRVLREGNVTTHELTARTDDGNQTVVSYNAITFNDWVGLEARARSDDGDPRVAIGVTDTGIGIRPEDQARLFRAFERLGPAGTRRIEGTGLHLCRKPAHLLGGQIEFRGEFGEGSTFTFVLSEV